MLKCLHGKSFRVRFLAVFCLFVILAILYITGQSLELTFSHNETLKKVALLHQDVKDPAVPALKKPSSYSPTGLGEFGMKVVLKNLTAMEKQEQQRLFDEYGINHFLSNKISLHRTIKDPRPPQ